VAEEKDKKCAHPVCSCKVSGQDKYCNEYCKDARDYTELAYMRPSLIVAECRCCDRECTRKKEARMSSPLDGTDRNFY
jgi:hypothetical protein